MGRDPACWPLIPSQEQAGHHRPVCTDCFATPSRGTAGHGAEASTDNKAVTRHLGACSPTGRSSVPCWVWWAGCGGKDLTSPLVRMPWAWPEARVLCIIYLLLHRGPLGGGWGGGQGPDCAQPSKLLAREGTVINDDNSVHFFGAFYLRFSKY